MQAIETAVFVSATGGDTAPVRAPHRYKLSCLQLIDDLAHTWELTEHGDLLAVTGQVDTSFGRRPFAVDLILCDAARVSLGDLYAVGAFLALPTSALPSAAIIGDEHKPGGALAAWDLLRVPELRCGDCQVRLRADRDGWRDGVIVTL